ncbi:hypothetical protein H696_00790 [Fonticula alba]|uniref:CDP-diacylglycerol-glycerol-3-phosphate 3-phosphatidyltransferase n=1 Tax=Fonticula alba TaxID=691883 RepID=A0A058ZFW4_FONAL|nr:hypothetical protein H696_00790 [Fonticula alba]KCV73249.1 hypothetical protein H696_00790 [Fonticula alba]|eukprot:XP_009492950.1 hypothetical protein H696_00790 [Fonticula alba]
MSGLMQAVSRLGPGRSAPPALNMAAYFATADARRNYSGAAPTRPSFARPQQHRLRAQYHTSNAQRSAAPNPAPTPTTGAAAGASTIDAAAAMAPPSPPPSGEPPRHPRPGIGRNLVNRATEAANRAKHSTMQRAHQASADAMIRARFVGQQVRRQTHSLSDLARWARRSVPMPQELRQRMSMLAAPRLSTATPLEQALRWPVGLGGTTRIRPDPMGHPGPLLRGQLRDLVDYHMRHAPAGARAPAIIETSVTAAAAAVMEELEQRMKRTEAQTSPPEGSVSPGPGLTPLSTDVMTLPNAISLARILVTPGIGYLVATNQLGLALVATALAGASDFLDGWLARRSGKSTVLGSILDPFADKLLVSTLTISLAINGAYADMPPAPGPEHAIHAPRPPANMAAGADCWAGPGAHSVGRLGPVHLPPG